MPLDFRGESQIRDPPHRLRATHSRRKNPTAPARPRPENPAQPEPD